MFLIDANVIIRFLTGDHKEYLEKSKIIFEQIERREIEVVILETVLMEAYFVLCKIYSLPKKEVVTDLKTILSLEGIVNNDKVVLFETLNILEQKNIDFVDSLICAKSKLQGYVPISFDKDIIKKCDKK